MTGTSCFSCVGSSSDGDVRVEAVEDEEGWSSCEEAEEEEATCLFCTVVLKSKQNIIEAVFAHSKQSHDLDMLQLLPSAVTDEFSYIKLINYLRKHVSGQLLVFFVNIMLKHVHYICLGPFARLRSSVVVCVSVASRYICTANMFAS